MTSATEVLRRLLDEQGVEWWEDAFSGEHRTVFDGKDGVRYCVYQLGSSLFISSILPVTPEQAIAATLGTGVCHDTGESRIFHCSECGLGLDDVFIDDEEYYPFADFPRFCPFCGAKVVGE